MKKLAASLTSVMYILVSHMTEALMPPPTAAIEVPVKCELNNLLKEPVVTLFGLIRGTLSQVLFVLVCVTLILIAVRAYDQTKRSAITKGTIWAVGALVTLALVLAKPALAGGNLVAGC